MSSGNASLSSRLAVRPVYPLWTNRRFVYGVVQEDENLIGDADLELVIEGVMDDIKVWCNAQDVSYVTWTNLNTVPIAIKRATTYGTVAALYSRRTNTFQSRVIPSVQPVTITVKGDAEKAMNHWENRYKEMLELYMTAEGGARLVVSTADEEPVFSMADIPSGSDPRNVLSWMEWVAEYGYPDEVEEE